MSVGVDNIIFFGNYGYIIQILLIDVLLSKDFKLLFFGEENQLISYQGFV